MRHIIEPQRHLKTMTVHSKDGYRVRVLETVCFNMYRRRDFPL